MCFQTWILIWHLKNKFIKSGAVLKKCLFWMNITLVQIYFWYILQTLVAGNNSCEVTRSTVQVVNGCPDSEESWKEAAVRKKCDVHAKQCSEPERLVYHCVINPNINQMLEVCAYAQNIVGGRIPTNFFLSQSQIS